MNGLEPVTELDIAIEEFDRLPGYHAATEIDGTDVHVFGIQHSVDLIPFYEPFFQEYMDDADGLLIEKPLGGEFSTEVDGNPFKDVADIAWEAGIDTAYQADPNDVGLAAAEGAGMGATVGITGYAGYRVTVRPYVWKAVDRVRNIFRSGEEQIDREAKDYSVSRRDFLKSARDTAAATYIGMGTLPAVIGKGMLDAYEDGDVDPDDMFHAHGLDDRLSYGTTDYRNVMIADGLERICEEEDVDTLVSVHGCYHGLTVLGYVEEDTVATVKEAGYLPYDVVSRDHVWKFEAADGYDWERVDRL